MQSERVTPFLRPRRLRRSESVRSLIRETILTPDDMVLPMFVADGEGIEKEIGSMPDIFQYSIDRLAGEVESALDNGISRVILFGIPKEKDPEGQDALSDDGIIQRAVRFLKGRFPELYVITDLCMCEYTSHGHCGILAEGDVDNDATLPYLAKQALTHARAGADMIAPSGMMDGMVSAIRGGLDGEGFSGIPIMSYSVKYASSFYGPFREAAESAPEQGDRKSYQMDPANVREAYRELELDIEKFKTDMQDPEVQRQIDEDVALSRRLGVQATPAFFINGRYLEGALSRGTFEGYIDEELALAEQKRGEGVKAGEELAAIMADALPEDQYPNASLDDAP